MELHERFQGVVPELAARAHLERILPIVSRVIDSASVEPLNELVAVAVATEPGLPGSLLVGLAAAKALCVAWDKPLISINHVQAHIYACQLNQPHSLFPCLGLVVSGGHTNLYDCQSPSSWSYLGGTIDDAIGEAFDKVAVMLGLPYPGGPHLSRLAESGNERVLDLPRPMVQDHSTLNMSFSGLKTAVRYKLYGVGNSAINPQLLSKAEMADAAASFQRAAVDCVLAKVQLALKRTRHKRLCVGGGVAANRCLRLGLEELTTAMGVQLQMAPLDLCTDNAVMGAIAWEKVASGQFEDLGIDIQPGLQRG
jgi:N6-L-threonylcarbamoyladenine synthase